LGANHTSAAHRDRRQLPKADDDLRGAAHHYILAFMTKIELLPSILESS
jgi:hypothetical protein